MHNDRQSPLVRERDDPTNLAVTQGKSLRARMQLDPPRAAPERAPRLGKAIGAWVDAAERNQLTIGAASTWSLAAR
jgi:hypothetical protein